MDNRRIADVLTYLPRTIRDLIKKVVVDDWLEIEEIRIRTGEPLAVCVWGESCFITPSGGITNYENKSYHISPEEVQSAFSAICENSVYAYMDEIRQGFITLKGGSRVGICGKAVVENGKVKTLREVSSLNFRIANEIIGVADGIIDEIVTGAELESTIIISPPQTGKTTILRDVTRQVSNRGFKVGIADDRGELAAMYKGVPQNDVGAQTDVIDNAPKSEAIEMLLRTMSPRVIVTDEIVCEKDVEAILKAAGTGVSVIATTHGSTIEEVQKRNILKPLFRAGVFSKAILLKRDFLTFESNTYTRTIKL